MSGVVIDGVHWEHCCICAGWVRFEDLGYEEPSVEFPAGRDIGICCVNKVPDIERIRPAPSWVAVYADA